MKKYLTLFSVIALFFAGTQFSNAQENRQQTPESIAKFKTHKMHELVELSGDQQREIFTLLVDAETNLAALNTSTMNIQNTQSARAEVMNSTNARIKTILTRDQYVVYKKYLDKENEEE